MCFMCVWCVFGVCLVCVWCVCGVCLVCVSRKLSVVLCVFRVCFVCVWCVFGVCFVCAWCVFGVCLGLYLSWGRRLKSEILRQNSRKCQ